MQLTIVDHKKIVFHHRISWPSLRPRSRIGLGPTIMPVTWRMIYGNPHPRARPERSFLPFALPGFLPRLTNNRGRAIVSAAFLIFAASGMKLSHMHYYTTMSLDLKLVSDIKYHVCNWDRGVELCYQMFLLDTENIKFPCSFFISSRSPLSSRISRLFLFSFARSVSATLFISVADFRGRPRDYLEEF